MSAHGPNRMMTSGEVAKIFRVDPKTVTRWAKAGRLRAIRTPGGHRRFRWSAVVEYLKEQDEAAEIEQLAQDPIPGVQP